MYMYGLVRVLYTCRTRSQHAALDFIMCVMALTILQFEAN